MFFSKTVHVVVFSVAMCFVGHVMAMSGETIHKENARMARQSAQFQKAQQVKPANPHVGKYNPKKVYAAGFLNGASAVYMLHMFRKVARK